jgi:hypothetical protein
VAAFTATVGVEKDNLLTNLELYLLQRYNRLPTKVLPESIRSSDYLSILTRSSCVISNVISVFIC